MGFINKLGDSAENLAQGVMGNLSELSPDVLTEKYGLYLMKGETIQTGYSLIRDLVIFTDRRIIDIDKQKVTGIKKRFDTIYLDSIIGVTLETAVLGISKSKSRFSK